EVEEVEAVEEEVREQEVARAQRKRRARENIKRRIRSRDCARAFSLEECKVDAHAHGLVRARSRRLMTYVARGVRQPPVLLANADFYGTLAATRSLGESGIPVYIADDSLLGVSRWSRHVARALPAPPVTDPSRFVDWILGVGAREPGIVLY